MSNATNTTNWCLASGFAEDDSWGSNHCAHEHGLWVFAQLVLWVAYCCGWLSTVWNIRRYRWVGMMRFGLFFYALLMCIWAGEIADAKDQLAYSLIILFVNFAHMIYISFHERPITLNDYLHNLWHKMFNMNGYNLELLDFYNLMQEKAFLKTYKAGQVYINEGDIPTQLSILLSGKMHVLKRDDWQRKSLYMAHHTTQYERASSNSTAQDAFVGCVYPYEFIDSYEWLMSQGEFKYETTAISQGTSQVSIKVPQYTQQSEDFSSKFRTARRTIQMPRFVDPDANEDNREVYPDAEWWHGAAADLPQQLPKDIFDMEVNRNDKDKSRMYKKVSFDVAESDWHTDQRRPEWCYMDDAAKDYLKERIDAARATQRPEAPVIVTTIPTIMFMWDIKDLKRLMLADPHVESALSTLLRSDITYKLNSAAPSALGTRLCGVPTQARGDQDIRMCAVTNE